MVVLFAIGICVYRARASTLLRLQADLRQKQTELAGDQARIATRGQLEKDYAGLRGQLAVLEPTLPTYAYIPTFLKQLDALAETTHNEVAGVRPLPKPLPAAAPSAPAEGEGGGEQAKAAKSEPASGQPKGAQPVGQAYDKLPIEVSLTGDYWNTAKFLSDLATFPKMIAINDMQFTPTTGAGGLGSRTTSLQVKVNLLALIYKGGEERSWTSVAKNSPS